MLMITHITFVFVLMAYHITSLNIMHDRLVGLNMDFDSRGKYPWVGTNKIIFVINMTTSVHVWGLIGNAIVSHSK